MFYNVKILWIATAAVAFSVLGAFMWVKKKRSFVKVGIISKLYFFPVKGLRGIEVNKGRCTKQGFEVNGFLDRSFMLINSEQVQITQKEEPSLALLTVEVVGETLTITTPSGKILTVRIKDSFTSDDKIVQCRVEGDSTRAIDCGDEAALFFQSYLNKPGGRLIHYFPCLSKRDYKPKRAGSSFKRKLRKENPNLAFQSLTAFHLVSKSSVDDLNSKLQDEKVSEINFRPNILVDGCKAFAEDSWRFIQFNSGALLCNLKLNERCIITTNDPATGIPNPKEPLETLRKYRIPTEPDVLKKTGPFPCLGIGCEVWKAGDIAVGDDIFADIGPQPKMALK